MKRLRKAEKIETKRCRCLASQEPLDRRQLPLRRKPPSGTGPDGAIASVVGARWRRRGLHYA